MSVLSVTSQKQVEDSRVHDGILTDDKLKKLKKEAEEKDVPLLSFLVSDGGVSNGSTYQNVCQNW